MLEAIGAWRFGPAYRGRDEATGRVVAIKTFDQGLTADQAARLAVMLERLGEAQLDHPAIGQVVAAGAAEERVWLAEPWFDGIALDILMRRDGAQPVGDVIFRITQVAAALDFAGAVGIHHGALHPPDILLSAERTVVMGIGVLQALADAGLHVPMDGAYVSPQRARGSAVSAQDDIFALAAITYELIYGDPVPDRSALRAEMTDVAGVQKSRLADVLEQSLSPDAAARHSTALAFAAAVQGARSTSIPIPIPIPIRNSDSDIHIRNSASDSDFESESKSKSQSESAVSMPLPISNSDLPLRAEPESESESDSRNRNRESESRDRHRKSESVSRRRWPRAVAFPIGFLLVGFVAGFVVGQRDLWGLPQLTDQRATRETSPAEGTPTPTVGRDYTESAVPQPPVTEPAETAPAESVRPQTGGTERPERSDRLEPGVLQVDSRPRGARVFLDGRLVGITPLVVSDVQPGDHAVRIDLRGHRRWVTAVRVEPGERERVAASLER